MNGAAYTMDNEGCRLLAFPDPLSGADPWTIGFGHTGPEVRKELKWSQQDCLNAFHRDYGDAIHCVEILLGKTQDGASFYHSLDAVRRAVFADLYFNIGHKLAKFDTFLMLVKQSKWEDAAKDLLGTEYAKELPKRAKRNADMLSSGEWQPLTNPREWWVA